jgi:hypothetical protein
VHTGATKDKLLKKEVIWWGAFVRSLIAETDQNARDQMKRMFAD